MSFPIRRVKTVKMTGEHNYRVVERKINKNTKKKQKKIQLNSIQKISIPLIENRKNKVEEEEEDERKE